jgi:hypothetical protein
MNILFCTPINIYSNLLETELELMQRHLDAGDHVHLLLCTGELPVCEINPTHSKLQCLYCSQKHLRSLRLLKGKVIVHHLKDYWLGTGISHLQTNFENIEALKKYRWDEHFDIGYGMGSYLISELRDPHLDIQPHQHTIKQFMEMSLRLYFAVQRFLDANPTQRLYVWNGRQPSMRPVIRAAKSRKVDFYTFNNAHTEKHVATFLNALLHDLGYMSNSIINYWNSSTEIETEKIKKAVAFYEKRTLNTHEADEDNLYSKNRFAAGMQAGQLPENWDASKINIAIFNSSEDEMASISDEWINPLYTGQFEGISRLIESTDNHPAFEQHHFYLRMHPNLADVDNEDVRRIKNLKGKRFTLLLPESPVSTYTLINESATVISYGSSAGIEAVYRDKPSILLGKCFYRAFENTTYQPETHEALVELLQQKLTPKSRTGAYMYGYFWSTYGTLMNNVSKENEQWLFRGKKAASHPLLEWLKKIKQKTKTQP